MTIPAVHRFHDSLPDRNPQVGQGPVTFDIVSSTLLAYTFGLHVAGFVQPESIVQLRGLICIHLERELQRF